MVSELKCHTRSLAMLCFHLRKLQLTCQLNKVAIPLNMPGHATQTTSSCCAGAGDDASNVGVMMELASNLVADPERLPASPVMFLFSGAEEPLCQVCCTAVETPITHTSTVPTLNHVLVKFKQQRVERWLIHTFS
eukprot:GHUV01048704.1.p1 GENE.GHUV01048704.1~~GHUV01048704.1.p1  ORF type:complete len:135 (+),score=14.48 GHUV01048704.1:1228-1632(+)